MSKGDIIINIFLDGDNGNWNFNCKCCSHEPFDIEDCDRAINVLQNGLRLVYKRRSEILEFNTKVSNEIKDMMKQNG